MDTILTYAIKLVIIVSVFIGWKYLIPLAVSKLENSDYAFIVSAIKEAVLFAEQTITASGSGTTKKEMVTALITELLDDKGIEYDTDFINALIEAAVYTMNASKTDSSTESGE